MRLLLLSLVLSSALTNADIVKLVQAGLSPETIETKIAVSESAFDTSTDALVALAGQGVPDRVIRRMVLAAATPAPVPPVPPAVPAPPVAASSAPQALPAVPAPPPAPVPAMAPSAPPAPAPKPYTRRYDVEVLTEENTRCTGAELRIDGKGLAATRCRKLDFTLPWSGVTRVCYAYGFRGTVTVQTATGTHRVSTTTPAEAKRIVDHIRVNAPGVPVAECGP